MQRADSEDPIYREFILLKNSPKANIITAAMFQI